VFDRPVIGPIGIDLGTHHVRLLQLASHGGRLEVIAAQETTTPPDPGPRACGSVFASVRPLLASGGFRGRRVVLAVTHPTVRVKNFRLPIMPDDELEQAVRFEAAERFQSLDAAPEIRYLNAGRVESAQGAQFELIVTAVRGDSLAAVLEATEREKLQVESIEFGPAAMFRPFERYLKRDEDDGQINGFLDIGHGGSRLIITHGDNIGFVKVLDIGCAALEAAIAASLGVSADETSDLYALSARNGDPASATAGDERLPAVWQAMAGSIEQLGKEIGLCLRYYAVTFRGLRPDGITCVGGGARHGSLLARLAGVVGVPINPGHPLRGVHCATALAGPDRRSGQPEWATAAGLAMRGMIPVREGQRDEAEAVVEV
jgi:type IV pilus assembly protein PilM